MFSNSLSNIKLDFWYKKKVPVVSSKTELDSGIACVEMLVKYHKGKSNFSNTSINLKSHKCDSLQSIMDTLSLFSLSSRTIKVSLNELDKLDSPCILQLSPGQYVILESANKNEIVTLDPLKGRSKLSKSEITKKSNFIALEISKLSSFTKNEKVDTLRFSDFWSKITGLKSSIILFTLSILLQVFAIASPYYVQLVIDNVILTSDTPLLVILVVGFSLILLFEVLTNILRGFTLLHFGHLMNIQLATNLFNHLIRLPISFYSRRHMGDVVSRFSSLQQVKDLLTTGVVEAIIDGLMAMATLGMLFFYSPLLAMIVLISVLLYSLARAIMYRAYHDISQLEIEAKAEENSNFMETVRGIQTIKLYNSEAKRANIWQNLYASSINQNIRLGHYQISYTAINRFLFGFQNIAVVYVAASLVISGGFSIGMMFASIAYKSQFMDRTIKLIEKLIEFKMLELHFCRLSDIALTEIEKEKPSSLEEHKVIGKISLIDATFKYSDDSIDLFSKLNLEINAGESVAITGPSGCGKSTLMKIMLGLNDLNEGQILIDDIPLDNLSKKNYRGQIGAVTQEDELFTGTIRDNITFFEPMFDQESVEKCAKLSSVHEFICSTPMGYETRIEDMGSSLSSGQKQRLILARALYKNPKILFMDEATSHLESKLEHDISMEIKKLNITRVIIAHRKDTIDSADRVINLENYKKI